MEADRKLNVNITVPFPTDREADIAYQVLRIDPEPKRSSVEKNLKLERNLLTIDLTTNEARQLRVAVTSVMENLILLTQTIDRFGPPRSEYSHY